MSAAWGIRIAGVAAMVAACANPAGQDGAGGGRPSAERAALLAHIDSIVAVPIAAGTVAGASVAVVRGHDTIVVKGYGKASLELDVPTPPHAVYEIGSVTKQFTAAGILQLVEQGKLDLDADVRTYLPDYDTQGRTIPVRRLLDHTSGIRGYTEIPEFGEIMVHELPRDSLVRIFARKPFDFEPGEEQIYNNSAYFLLGLIIEKVSGTPYEQYVRSNLFERAAMQDAHYCSVREIQRNKVEGYDMDSAGLVIKGYLDHTWPYAAGSLCASAVDLVAWNQALHGGRILGREMYREMITPDTLNDGTRLRYAKGLATNPRAGHPALHHGGGINGFLSSNLYFPEDSLSIVVLFNTAGREAPDAVADAIATAMLGPGADPAQPFEGSLGPFEGTFAGLGRGRPAELVFAAENGVLTVRGAAPGDSAAHLTFVGDDTFALRTTLFRFIRADGAASALRVDRGAGNNLLRRK
jgi:CubicO group peptidase (beta-lactamase class C family)